jgi:hypothetical protein
MASEQVFKERLDVMAADEPHGVWEALGIYVERIEGLDAADAEVRQEGGAVILTFRGP